MFPVVALAGTYTFIEPIPSLGDNGSLPRADILSVYLTRVYQITLTTAAILAMFFIIVGGVRYVITAISPSDKASAKTMIWNAVGGLLIVLAGWLVLWTINPDFVNFRITVPTVPTSPPG